MAKETKADYFRVSQENYVIDLWETFGWEVVTTQKCDYNGYDAVKITFSRDKEMKNYGRLAELHNLYQKDADLITKLNNEKNNLLKSVSEPPKFNILFVIIGCFGGVLPLIIYLIYYFKTKKRIEEEYQKAKKKSKEIEEQGSVIIDRMDKYIAEAKELL